MRLEPSKVTWQVRDGDEAAGCGLLAGSSDRSTFGVRLIGPLSLDEVNFLTLELDSVTGEPEWNLNAGGGLDVADLDGSDLRQPGHEGRRVAGCIAAAKGDPATIQACALQ